MAEQEADSVSLVQDRGVIAAPPQTLSVATNHLNPRTATVRHAL